MPSPHIVDLKKPTAEKPAAATPQVSPTPPPALPPEASRDQPGSAPFKPFFTWEAAEFENREKPRSWYLTLAAVAGALMALALWRQDYFAAALLAIAAGVVWLFAKQEPRLLRFAITSRGVQAGPRLYLFDDLISFWIFYDPPHRKELSLRSKHLLMPYVRMALGDADPVALREHLLRFLPELKHQESVVDAFSRRIGF